MAERNGSRCDLVRWIQSVSEQEMQAAQRGQRNKDSDELRGYLPPPAPFSLLPPLPVTRTREQRNEDSRR
jgi:hypothetical protein